MEFIVFIWLRVIDRDTVTLECNENGTCDCMQMFDISFAIFLLLVCACTALKVKLSCTAMRSIFATRRMLKKTIRKQEIIFTCCFFVVLACMIFGYFKDRSREECLTDNRFEKMNTVAVVIMCLSTVLTLYLIIRSINIFRTLSRANKRRYLDPPQLSSDEEDD